FWRGAVQFIVLVPFRPDSLSLIAFAHRVLGPGVQASVILGPLIGLAVLGLCLRRRLGLPMAAAAAAASWAVVLLWSKQSFCNYWWLAAARPDRARVRRASGDRHGDAGRRGSRRRVPLQPLAVGARHLLGLGARRAHRRRIQPRLGPGGTHLGCGRPARAPQSRLASG